MFNVSTMVAEIIGSWRGWFQGRDRQYRRCLDSVKIDLSERGFECNREMKDLALKIVKWRIIVIGKSHIIEIRPVTKRH